VPAVAASDVPAVSTVIITAAGVIPAVSYRMPKELLPFYGFLETGCSYSFIFNFLESVSTMLWSSYTESHRQLRNILLRNNNNGCLKEPGRDLSRLKTVSRT